MKERISKIILNSIKRGTEHCPKCNQEFLYEQKIDIDHATDLILEEMRKELLDVDEIRKIIDEADWKILEGEFAQLGRLDLAHAIYEKQKEKLL